MGLVERRRYSAFAVASGLLFTDGGVQGAAVRQRAEPAERGCPTALPRTGLDGGDAKGKVARHNLTLHNGELYNTVLRVGA
jgi:hypothetical protein